MNSSAAFERASEQFYDEIVGWFVNDGFGADADDLAGETFLRATKSLGTYDGRASWRTWLFAIAHNVKADELRRHKGRRPTASSTKKVEPVITAQPRQPEPTPEKAHRDDTGDAPPDCGYRQNFDAAAGWERASDRRQAECWDDAADSAELSGEIIRRQVALPTQDREIFELSKRGYSEREIAARLGLPVRHVHDSAGRQLFEKFGATWAASYSRNSKPIGLNNREENA